MANAAILVLAGKGIGTGLALVYFKLKDLIYKNWVYVGPRQNERPPICQIYDSSFIRDLKRRD